MEIIDILKIKWKKAQNKKMDCIEKRQYDKASKYRNIEQDLKKEIDDLEFIEDNKKKIEKSEYK